MLEIAGELTRTGSEVEFSSSGEVASLIERKGYRCNRLPLADVRYSENGEFSLKQTLIASPSILARTYQQLSLELANLMRFAPEAVLSDSALSTLLAGKFLGIPTFTVLNQLNLNSSHEGGRSPARILSVGTSAAMGRLWELSDEVLLPDLPPPYTISEKNLWSSNVSKTRYIGFLGPSGFVEPDAAARQIRSEARPKVFWQVSGPPKTRGVFVKVALETARALSREFVFVVSGGSPTSDRSPVKIQGGWFYPWCGISEYYFDECDVIVSRAGHGTIGQAITASQPLLLVPIPKQPEQEGNAQKAVRLGVALEIAQDELSVEKVENALSSLLGEETRRRARALGEVASQFDAKREVLRTLQTVATSAHR